MIEYDYLLERDIGEGRIQKLQPSSIPTEIPNLLRIEGPNSIGKSTLLNIIALGFWGTESRKIHPALLEKMSTLLSSDYQRLKFRVKIGSEKESLVLVSTKPSLEKKEIMVEESLDGKTYKPITRERFEDKYNLIYDIASNPIERLYDLLKDLREEERQFGNRFKDFGSYLRRLILDIDSSRNQERLDEVNRTIERLNQENSEITAGLPALGRFLDLLETNAYVHFHYYYLNQSETLSKKIADYEEKSKNLEKGGHKIGSQLLKCR
jgi:exonuclease SbcC